MSNAGGGTRTHTPLLRILDFESHANIPTPTVLGDRPLKIERFVVARLGYGIADEFCSDLIRQFRDSDDPDEFMGSGISEPDDWPDWPKDQKWNWLFGLTENPSGSDSERDGGFGWVNLPFEVREMHLPASAVVQRALAARCLKEDVV